MSVRKKLSAVTALVAMAASQAAAAQDCITEQEAVALAIYGAPAALDAARSACRSTLPSDSFLISGTGQMKARYNAERAQYWPSVASGITKMVGRSSDGNYGEASLLLQLPERDVRPLVDALIAQELADEIKPESCADINRIVRSVAPLDPMEFGRVVGAVLVTALSKSEDTMFCSDA